MEALKNDAGNKRIAKNTLIVYLQLIVTMIMNLILSRLVLNVLGASDFGLYNVVGGIIALFTMISASMTVTTTRFLNYEQGKEFGDTNKIFNQSFVLHISIAIIVFLLLETIGSYYIANYLNVPKGKEDDAMFIFQISTFISSIGILTVPFQSLFSVFEKFSFIAMIEIVTVLLRLLGVISLYYVNGNELRIYAIIMCLTTLFSVILYTTIGIYNWPKIIKWRFYKDWHSYKEQFFFSGWNFLGIIAVSGRTQGSAILINLFFGTVVNAAYALANSVLQQIIALVGRFDVAVAPQLTQSIGSNDYNRALYLTSHVCRLCILLMEIVVISLFVELDYVLHLWLGNSVPEGTETFCTYMFAIALFSSTSSGLLQFINGLGDIKWFRIQMAVWYGASLLGGYVFYDMGYSPYALMIMFILSDILNRIFQFYLLKKKYGFNIWSFIKGAYYKPTVLFVCLIVWYFIYSRLGYDFHYQRIFGIIITSLLSFGLAFRIGLYTNERERILGFCFSKLKIIYDKYIVK